MLRKKSPKLTQYFDSIDMTSETFALDWLFTIYSRAFDLECSRMIWDVVIVFGSYYALLVGVIILSELEEQIIKQTNVTSFVRSSVKSISFKTIMLRLLNKDPVSHLEFEKMLRRIAKKKQTKALFNVSNSD